MSWAPFYLKWAAEKIWDQISVHSGNLSPVINCSYGATWTVSDDYLYLGSQVASASAFGTDNSGNSFIGGTGTDVSFKGHWLVRKSADHGVTWNNVDDYLYAASSNSVPTGIVADSLNNIYVAGVVSDSGGLPHWMVRKSTDHGATWALLDYYLFPAATDGGASVALAVDSLDNLYEAGSFIVSTTSHWIVRKSTDQGATWSSVDNYTYPGGTGAAAIGMGFDLTGALYVGGNGTTSTDSHWIVRKSTDHGVTWNTVDNYLYTVGSTSSATGFTTDSSGNIFFGGFGTASSTYHWLVRKSLDHGATWNNVDDYQYPSGSAPVPQALVVDYLSTIYAAGSADDSGSHIHWVVRKSSDYGSTWNLNDDYVYATAQPAQPNAMGMDSAKNIYSVGGAIDSSTTLSHWVVRSLRCN